VPQNPQKSGIKTRYGPGAIQDEKNDMMMTIIIIVIEMIIITMNCLAKSRSTLDNSQYGWTCSMEADLRNILVNPFMETDDGGGDKGVSVCSLCVRN